MITKSVFLPLAQAAAFDLFTTKINVWCPPENRHTGDPLSTLFMQASGRFYERGNDGREVELGKVLTWEPLT